jgi:ABC-type polysaccharide transport system permease subunit
MKSHAKKTEYWSTCPSVMSYIIFVSLPLLGTLGTRQDFQNVSGREIAQVTGETQKWCCIQKRQNIEGYMHAKTENRITCPSVLHTITFVSLPLLGKLGTRQDFQKVSGWEIAQVTGETQKWCCMHKWQKIEARVRPSCAISLLCLFRY